MIFADELYKVCELGHHHLGCTFTLTEMDGPNYRIRADYADCA